VPELPEVETVRRALEPRLVGRVVVDAGGHPSAKFADAPLAVGAEVVAVGRRGKYLLVPLSGERELIVHLGMTGQLRLRPGDAALDPFVRAWWRLDDGERLELRDVRRFGRVAVVPAGAYTALPTLAALGPEPFDEAFTAAALWQALRASSARVKTQLLSQRPVAGVGNIYADEALWMARVHPSLRGPLLSRPAAARLHEALRAVLAAGIDHGGTTLRDYRTLEEGEGTNQFHLQCYGRSPEPCLRCGTALRRQVWDGRSATFCPRCQRLRR
jgi:formamidopyrimidine-DNA glycosylase